MLPMHLTPLDCRGNHSNEWFNDHLHVDNQIINKKKKFKNTLKGCEIQFWVLFHPFFFKLDGVFIGENRIKGLSS